MWGKEEPGGTGGNDPAGGRLNGLPVRERRQAVPGAGRRVPSSAGTGGDQAVGQAAGEPLEETGQAIGEWVFEKVVERAAEAARPGLARAPGAAFKLKELVGDVQVLAGRESGSGMPEPVISIAPGAELELRVHLPGQDADSAGCPRVRAFVSASDDGLFGGWAIEREEDRAATGQEGQSAGPDGGQPLQVVIPYALPEGTREAEPLRRAAMLRAAAPKLLPWLRAMPDYRRASVVVVFDDHAECGQWMVLGKLSDRVCGRRIRMRYRFVPGMAAVLIRGCSST